MQYKLYRGNDFLGTITHTKNDFPWHWGTFEPTVNFQSIQILFEQEIEYLESENIEKMEEVWKEIEKPGLRLVSNQDKQEITEFLIHIDGKEVWWRC